MLIVAILLFISFSSFSAEHRPSRHRAGRTAQRLVYFEPPDIAIYTFRVINGQVQISFINRSQTPNYGGSRILFVSGEYKTFIYLPVMNHYQVYQWFFEAPPGVTALNTTISVKNRW